MSVMLHEFIADHREEIILRCRPKVATRSIPLPTEAEVNQGVPLLLDQLVHTLRFGQSSSPEMRRDALARGHDLLVQGFTVSQVVYDYSNIGQSILELAMEMDAPISMDDFRTLSRCLDDAIAAAVCGAERHQSTLDGESAVGCERLGFLAHELRNLTNTALLAFDVVKTGNVGVGGSTGAVLHRSLTDIHALLGRSLAEVRLTQHLLHREQFLVSEFIEELAAAAALDAIARGIGFTVMPVEECMVIDADRQVLAAVVENILENAFKFTLPHTAVTLRVEASAERVLIEIQDECGGLPGWNANNVFRPFEQRSADRTGSGLGLAFSRWGVEANDGRIYGRTLPDGGCVFTVDLPRCPVPALAIA